MIWNIVSDSSCDLQSRDFSSDRVRFELVPLRIQVGEREFVDNDDLVVPDLLAAMAEEKSASSTACPSPEAFARAFAAGDRTVCFTISANLSGTYNAAVLGREMVLEEHPEKEVCIIDSKSTAGAMVLLIRRARELMEADTTGDFADLRSAAGVPGGAADLLHPGELRQPDQKRADAAPGGDVAALPGHPCDRGRHAPGDHPRGGQGPGRGQNLQGHHQPDGGQQGLCRRGGGDLPL